ncbi:MAG: NAD(+)/NADH kinase, partial [Actinomycetota bacterium]|nr:NAD(+)/NADH kinase [Actinomycetota bacterium]
MKVGLVIHSGRKDSLETAVDAARQLEALGVDVIAARQDSEPVRFPVEVLEPDDFPRGLDFAISFGGDGTFLRAAYLCRDAGIPVLGVNLGRLGFLAEVDRDDLPMALTAVVKGNFV